MSQGSTGRRRTGVTVVALVLLALLGATTLARTVPARPESLVARYHLAPLPRPRWLPAVPSADGALFTLRIPASDARYRPRPALLYLPPEVRRHPDRPLPVLELLHGEPGQPADWVRRGRLVALETAFAREHGGQAPIVVLPDVNGIQHLDTECIRSAQGGDIERYLAQDVPRFLAARLPAARAPQAWTVAGLSEGGTCALMLGLRHPRQFASIVDLSGLDRPTLTHEDNATLTTRVLFGGSRAAYTAHDPLHLLATRRFAGTGVWLECGADEPAYRHADAVLTPRLRSAGVSVHALVVPGRHDWTLWSGALGAALPWLWQRATVG